jgi:hypothetical protein
VPIPGIGPLRRADEGLNHQIADTFGTVVDADYSWTEKIWTSLARRDGSLQIDFGIGRYHNRGVIDAFGGASRGVEQWTVRASRELSSDPEGSSVGPLHYEIVEPLSKVRVRLERNDLVALSFDLVLEGVLPPFFEVRNDFRQPITGRVNSNVVRYHQGGIVSGTIWLEGEEHAVDSEEWFGFRDHSWGIRGPIVGSPPPDLMPAMRTMSRPTGIGTLMHWTPWWLRRPDGTYVGFHLFLTQTGGSPYFSAFLNHADGQQEPMRVESHMSYNPRTRFLEKGEIHLETEAGERSVYEVEPVGQSGFHLATGGYGDWKDQRHGRWHGPLHVDGEYLSDCRSEENLPRMGQFRDTPIRVRGPEGVGFGIFENIIMGDWPELGLGQHNTVPPF